ncbi:hypothetical protein AAF712_000138 [Marasmius tenuissimus]|uniref:Tr-type G domain-containing protein n=1 Tax=Marasmius tenuissimus TaxID=585030 RepID=A0ABR3AEM9_9AGAR
MASNTGKTSLTSFQSEIQEIHHREVAKQRTQMAASGGTAVTATKDVVPDKKDTKSKAKVMPDNKETLKGKSNEAPKVEVTVEDTQRDTSEMEEKILSLLLTNSAPNRDQARDIIATLITQHHGEYVLRIGAQPPHEALFAGQLTDDTDGWKGIERTADEVELLRGQVTSTVEEIGGKVRLIYSSAHITSHLVLQTCVLFESKGKHSRMTLLLRLPPASVALTPEVRCAVVGNVDSGKSTTLGVLTRGALDDGRGKARVGLFRHKHEIETGRTSSVGMEILGFDPAGKPILPDTAGSSDPEVIRREKLGWEEISVQAAKIVSFIDLAGHEKYLKTTLYGLTSGAPSCVVLIVGANAGLIGMSKEHLSIALALSVPVVVCVTKIDMTPTNVMEETIKQVVKILKSPGCRKIPVFVKSQETAVEVATTFGKDKICPILQVSNVTGEGLDYLRTFLNLLPSSEADTDKFAVDQPLEVLNSYCISRSLSPLTTVGQFSITEVWSVPYVGTVVNGIVNSGRVSKGDAVIYGPDSNGNYQTTSVKDMQRKRAPVTTAEAGQCVSLALKRVRRPTVRKGMVLVHRAEKAEVPPPRGLALRSTQV